MASKALFVIDNLCTGGAEQVFSDISWLMVGHYPFHVMFVLPSQTQAYTIPEVVDRFYLNRKNKWSLRSLWKCYRILREYKVVHIHLRHTFRYIALIKLVFRLPIRLILHDHHGSIGIDKSPPFWGYKFLIPDFYIGVSNDLTKWAIELWKIPENNTLTLVNLPSKRFLDLLNNKQNSSADRTPLVMVGNIKPVKNQGFAIDLAQKLGLSITLIGKKQDDDYYAELLNAVSNTNTVVFRQDVDDVSNSLFQFKLGVYCSKSESGPLVILEYLLCGLPFIAYKTGGMAEVISKYFPEYFLDNFNIEEWISRVNSLLEANTLVDTAQLNLMIKNEFNPEKYREKLLQVYETQ